MFDPYIPVVFNVLPEDLLVIYHRYGFRRFFLCGPGIETRLTGMPDLSAYESIGKRMNELKEAVQGTDIEINWWCAPTIGCGVGSPFQHLVNWNGTVSENANCPLDTEFRKDFAAKIAKVAEIAHPDVILFEDDLRFMWHMGISKGCFCPLHMKEFSRILGREISREELVRYFQEDKPETQPERRIFAELAKKSFQIFAEEVRKAVNAVAPETRLALCESAATDCDGYHTINTARAFAGGTKPLVRVFGTTYSCANGSFQILSCLEHTMYTAERLPEDFEWMHESDTYPHTRYFMSATTLEALIHSAMAFGADNSLLYAAQYADDPVEDTGYFEMASRNTKRFSAISDFSKKGHFEGCRLIYDPASLSLKFLSPAGSGGSGFASGFGMFGRFGIPFSTRYGSPAVLFGQTADVLPDDEIRAILSDAVLLDAEAAEILEKRGFGEYLGVRTERLEKYNFSFEKIADIPEFQHIKGRLIYNLAFQPAGGEKALYLKLIPEQGCDVLSYYGNQIQPELQPGMVRFTNHSGGRVCIIASCLSGNNSSNIYSYRKKEMVRIVLEWLRGESFPATVRNAPNVWLLCRKTETELIFYLTNLTADIMDGLDLRIPADLEDAEFEELDLNGNWGKIQVCSRNGTVNLPGIFFPQKMRIFRTVKT